MSMAIPQMGKLVVNNETAMLIFIDNKNIFPFEKENLLSITIVIVDLGHTQDVLVIDVFCYRQVFFLVCSGP